MIVIGKEHKNIIPAAFVSEGDKMFVDAKAICGKLFRIPVEHFINHFSLMKGTQEELLAWIIAGGDIEVS